MTCMICIESHGLLVHTWHTCSYTKVWQIAFMATRARLCNIGGWRLDRPSAHYRRFWVHQGWVWCDFRQQGEKKIENMEHFLLPLRVVQAWFNQLYLDSLLHPHSWHILCDLALVPFLAYENAACHPTKFSSHVTYEKTDIPSLFFCWWFNNRINRPSESQ